MKLKNENKKQMLIRFAHYLKCEMSNGKIWNIEKCVEEFLKEEKNYQNKCPK